MIVQLLKSSGGGQTSWSWELASNMGRRAVAGWVSMNSNDHLADMCKTVTVSELNFERIWSCKSTVGNSPWEDMLWQSVYRSNSSCFSPCFLPLTGPRWPLREAENYCRRYLGVKGAFCKLKAGVVVSAGYSIVEGFRVLATQPLSDRILNSRFQDVVRHHRYVHFIHASKRENCSYSDWILISRCRAVVRRYRYAEAPVHSSLNQLALFPPGRAHSLEYRRSRKRCS